MIKLLSLFSGIGAFEAALRRGGYQFETVNYCEIDPYASKAYSQIHGISEDFNLHDVRQVNTLLMDNINLMTWGWPCQDISVAGKQRGFKDNDGNLTRSGLFFQGLRILTELQPEYAIAENVKALTGKKFTAEFETVLTSLDKAGYNNYWKVLNAKDYGIPQNRERVFIISIRKDIDTGTFTFPEKQELKLRVKDILENSVDEKYYINTDKAKELIKKFIENNQINEIDQNPKIQWCGSYNGHQSGNVVYERGICNCIDVAGHVEPQKIMISKPKIKRLGNLYDENAGGARAGNVYAPDGLAPALQTAQGGNRQPLIFSNDPVICASRGRNPENPSNREKGCNTEQTLELKKDGCSNTLTTVQKDNLVVEPQILKYERTEYAKSIRKEYENGELSERRCNMRQYTTRKDGMSNTLTTVHKDNLVVKPINYESDGTARTIKSQYYKTSTANFERTGTHGATGVLDVTNYRIRKLTPRECFRLMGFTDEDFDKIKGISNTQLYKMAGNSIVVNVLEAIFRNLFKKE